jgi:hypothetical protein
MPQHAQMVGSRRCVWQHHTLITLSPGKPLYLLYRRLSGTQGWSEQVWSRANPLPTPGFEPWTIKPVMSCYINSTTLAPPSPGSERWATWMYKNYVEHIITYNLGNDCYHWIQNILSCHGQFKIWRLWHKTVIVPVYVDLKLDLALLRDGFSLEGIWGEFAEEDSKDWRDMK